MNAESLAPPPLTADVALFLDFDGTLVDIAPRPADVRIPANLIPCLDQVAWLLSGALAVVSGRPLPVIDAFLDQSVRCAAGLHGAERRNALGHVRKCTRGEDVLDSYRAILGAFSAAHAGLLLEDKGASLALHFRGDPALKDACRQAVDECVTASHGLFERLDGKMVAELKPAGITKVTAVEAYMNEAPFAGRRPVFVGDDVTDEIAFVHVSKTNGFGVKVGMDGPTAAATRLPSVAALHQWLKDFCDHAHAQ
ncbi:MAG: trehalose-phosphatase [Rhodospirillaceae bacterium]|nr:trehalose-phosphatase [Rhodospirillaceae bacterium]